MKPRPLTFFETLFIVAYSAIWLACAVNSCINDLYSGNTAPPTINEGNPQ